MGIQRSARLLNGAFVVGGGYLASLAAMVLMRGTLGFTICGNYHRSWGLAKNGEEGGAIHKSSSMI